MPTNTVDMIKRLIYARDKGDQVSALETVVGHLYARRIINGSYMALLVLVEKVAPQSTTACLRE